MTATDATAMTDDQSLVKRSLTIAGHRTSIALEPAFWDGLDHMAASTGVTVAQLIRKIDQSRGDSPLASSLRIAILRHFMAENPD